MLYCVQGLRIVRLTVTWGKLLVIRDDQLRDAVKQHRVWIDRWENRVGSREGYNVPLSLG